MLNRTWRARDSIQFVLYKLWKELTKLGIIYGWTQSSLLRTLPEVTQSSCIKIPSLPLPRIIIDLYLCLRTYIMQVLEILPDPLAYSMCIEVTVAWDTRYIGTHGYTRPGPTVPRCHHDDTDYHRLSLLWQIDIHTGATGAKSAAFRHCCFLQRERGWKS
jgi:hypothetical protein